MHAPLVTAIVSTYNSERFMKGCLEDLLSQTIASDVEIIVIDSGSQQNERAICQEFIKLHNNIRYFRTEREGLYAAWNRIISLSQGKYLTSANTDDRHRHDAFERLVTELEKSPDISLAYGDQLISAIENETFEACEIRGAKKLKRPNFDPNELLIECLTGSQPMWRRSVHDEHGVFNPHFRIAGDFEFWLRIAQTSRFLHIPEPLGVLYESPDTISGSNNGWQLAMENLEIKLMYLDREPWSKDRALRTRIARQLLGTGYFFVEKQRDFDKARPFLFHAWKLEPFNINMAKTFILRGVIKSNWRLE